MSSVWRSLASVLLPGSRSGTLIVGALSTAAVLSSAAFFLREVRLLWEFWRRRKGGSEGSAATIAESQNIVTTPLLDNDKAVKGRMAQTQDARLAQAESPFSPMAVFEASRGVR